MPEASIIFIILLPLLFEGSNSHPPHEIVSSCPSLPTQTWYAKSYRLRELNAVEDFMLKMRISETFVLELTCGLGGTDPEVRPTYQVSFVWLMESPEEILNKVVQSDDSVCMRPSMTMGEFLSGNNTVPNQELPKGCPLLRQIAITKDEEDEEEEEIVTTKNQEEEEEEDITETCHEELIVLSVAMTFSIVLVVALIVLYMFNKLHCGSQSPASMEMQGRSA